MLLLAIYWGMMGKWCLGVLDFVNLLLSNRAMVALTMHVLSLVKRHRQVFSDQLGIVRDEAYRGEDFPNIKIWTPL